MTAPTIVPHLWFDREALAAARFYADVFPDAAVEHVAQIRDTPAGDCEIVWFRIGGQPFQAISAGPAFRINPSISFIVNFDPSRNPAGEAGARQQLDAVWARLADGGQVRMPLDATFFSPRYGSVEDRFGVSWQLILTDPAGEPRPFITPALLFTGERCGQAEAAGAFWRSVFDDSDAGQLLRYPADMAPNVEGTVMYSDVRLGDTWIAAMDAGGGHAFQFNEAVSLMVMCRDQAEVDRTWSRLSAVPEAEMCGWCKDRFGVSWQVVPQAMDTMLRSGDTAAIDRVTQAFLQMKKFDIAALERAFEGRE